MTEKTSDNDERKIVLPQGDYAAYLATVAADMADEKLKRRETRWRTIISVGIAALAIFGYANLSSFMSGITERVEKTTKSEIDKVFKERYETLREEVDAKLAFVQINTLASSFKENGSINERDKQSVLAQAKIIRDSMDLLEPNQFIRPLYTIIDAFDAARLGGEIDQLDTEIRPLLEDYEGTVRVLLQHYGLRLAGAIQLQDADINRFRNYAAVAREDHSLHEYAAVWELALNVKENGNTKTRAGEEIIRDVLYLHPTKKDTFARYINYFTSDQSTKTGEIVRIQNIFATIKDVYSENLLQLFSDNDDEYGYYPLGSRNLKELEELKENLLRRRREADVQ